MYVFILAVNCSVVVVSHRFPEIFQIIIIIIINGLASV